MAKMYVDIDLTDVDDDELIEELEDRGYSMRENLDSDIMESLRMIYEARRLNKPYEHMLESMLMNQLGKVI